VQSFRFLQEMNTFHRVPSTPSFDRNNCGSERQQPCRRACLRDVELTGVEFDHALRSNGVLFVPIFNLLLCALAWFHDFFWFNCCFTFSQYGFVAAFLCPCGPPHQILAHFSGLWLRPPYLRRYPTQISTDFFRL
jgi:hypothetical protein